MSKRILIAEDDKFLANAYRVKLEKEGYEILIVENGLELLEKIEDFKPSAILLDLVMPKMDGFEALEKLNSSETGKRIPVIIASNLSQKSDQEKSLDLGAREYIIKSNLSLEQVVEKIKELTP